MRERVKREQSRIRKAFTCALARFQISFGPAGMRFTPRRVSADPPKRAELNLLINGNRFERVVGGRWPVA